MAFRQRIGKLGGCKPKRNHESQVEQKFEWGRDAVQLVWIAPAHPSRVMVQGVGTGRHRVHTVAIRRIILSVSSRGRRPWRDSHSNHADTGIIQWSHCTSFAFESITESLREKLNGQIAVAPR